MHPVFFPVLRRRPRTTLFPYTTLFRSRLRPAVDPGQPQRQGARRGRSRVRRAAEQGDGGVRRLPLEDRKSTRLNFSHLSISYAVFCLKKKTTITTATLSPS